MRVTIFGNRTFKRWLSENEVVGMGLAWCSNLTGVLIKKMRLGPSERHQQCACTEERPCEDIQRWRPPAGQKMRPAAAVLLLSLFSRVRLCVTPQTAAHQAPPSLGFSRQEHWSGLPFPSPMQESEKSKWSRSVVSDSSRPHGLQPTRLLHPWDFPGKSTGVGCHCLLWKWDLEETKPANTLIVDF